MRHATHIVGQLYGVPNGIFFDGFLSYNIKKKDEKKFFQQKVEEYIKHVVGRKS
jgi:hypothetical protein